MTGQNPTTHHRQQAARRLVRRSCRVRPKLGGIVRIGRFDDGDLDTIERQPDGFAVAIE
jgi:hypothetical protein